MDSYNTVEGESLFELIEKRSRFLALVSHAQSEEDAQWVIANVKKRHFDANHNVYAYRVKEGNMERFSDDGEPSGTAGAPIMNLLQRAGLYDVVTVVTRYFGGTLLGIGGLIRAYSSCAKGAIGSANVVAMEKNNSYELRCDYKNFDALKKALEISGAKITSVKYFEDIFLAFLLPDGKEAQIKKDIESITFGKSAAQKTGEVFVSI